MVQAVRWVGRRITRRTKIGKGRSKERRGGIQGGGNGPELEKRVWQNAVIYNGKKGTKDICLIGRRQRGKRGQEEGGLGREEGG